MRVDVRMHRGALRTLTTAQVKSVTLTAIEMLSRTRNEAVMPFDTGNLQNDSTYVDDSAAKGGKVTIVSDTPYARRLYFHPEYTFNQSKNASARGEWWEPYLTGNQKNEPMKLFKEFYRRQSGGIVR